MSSTTSLPVIIAQWARNARAALAGTPLPAFVNPQAWAARAPGPLVPGEATG